MTTKTIDVSDNWTVTQREIGVKNARTKITATHDEHDVSIVVKEQPNGGVLRLQVPADLPGGYDVVHTTEFTNLAAAQQELERYTAMHDTEGTWLVDGKPVLRQRHHG